MLWGSAPACQFPTSGPINLGFADQAPAGVSQDNHAGRSRAVVQAATGTTHFGAARASSTATRANSGVTHKPNAQRSVQSVKQRKSALTGRDGAKSSASASVSTGVPNSKDALM